MGDVAAAWVGKALVVVGVTASATLAVVPAEALAFTGRLVPTAGGWTHDLNAARFTPRFTPVPGTAYAVVTRSTRPDAGWTELARVTVPADATSPSTFVEAIDPGCAQVPQNLLRFSVTFSAPMDEGSAAGHVHLLGDDGTELPGTLLPMPPELWDRERRRLTVLLEPGRIKRGLQPNVQAGSPLAGLTSVTLVVDAQLRDARGIRLVAGAERSYSIGEPLRSRVDPGSWDLRWPTNTSHAATSQAGDDSLVVRFGRPLDRALVQRCLSVHSGEDERLVPGTTSLEDGASTWVFTPALPAGALRLHVHRDLEDLAGNSVRRVFDRDLFRKEEDSLNLTEIVLTSDGQVLTC